jgi:hypothetical protein
MTPTLLILKPGQNHQEILQSQLKQAAAWEKVFSASGKASQAGAGGKIGASGLVTHPDIVWLNQDQTGLKIAAVRELQTQLGYRPYQSSERAFLICRLDSASIPAQNALLKILEEPPGFARILLTAENEASLLPTITSRCVVVRVAGAVGLAGGSAADNLGRRAEKVAQNSATAIYQQIIAGSHADAIVLASQYKDRDQAQQLLAELVASIHADSDYPTAAQTKHLLLVMAAQRHLSQNVNVLLALENCFFGMIS